MKKMISSVIVVSTMIVNITAQTLSPSAALLFKDVKSKLTIAEKNQIAKMSKLTLSPDKKSFILADDPETEYSVAAYPLDLNRDGIEEVFIGQFSTWFGHSGEEFSIYYKGENGIYQSAVGVLGNPLLLESVQGGYPDMVIGGPGFQFPIWQWNGKGYSLAKSISSDELQKLKTKEIEAASNEYTSGSIQVTNAAKPAEVITAPEVESKQVMPVEEALTAHAASLFKNVKTKLSNSEKNLITKKSGLFTTDTIFVSGISKTKVAARPLPIDLNKDGKEEIFISVKTTEIGITSTAFKFYSVDAAGIFQSIPKDILGSIKIISTANMDFPDLLTGIPGFDRELWKWNGRTYNFNMKINGLAALAYKVNSIESESEKYTSSIK